MNAACKEILNKATWLGFALPNGVIAFLLTWWGMRGVSEVTFGMMQTELPIVALLTGLIIPFFGPLNLGGYVKKVPGMSVGVTKSGHAWAKWLPLNMFGGAVVISLVTALVFGILPIGILTLVGFEIVVSPMVWIGFKVVYTIFVAAFSGYLTCLHALYGMVEKGRVSIGLSA